MYEEIFVVKMTPEYAKIIASWTYDGDYSIYNHDEEFVNECMDRKHFTFINSNNELLGYFCFGTEARIPTTEKNVYNNDFTDIGLHIRPDLTGKKLGNHFLDVCLNYIQNNFNTNRFRATIASFNKRALRLCVKAGFNPVEEVTHLFSEKKFTIVTLVAH